MQVEVYHGAGIDIHKDTAVVTIRHQAPDQLTPLHRFNPQWLDKTRESTDCQPVSR